MNDLTFDITARTPVTTPVAPAKACRLVPARAARTSGGGTVLVEARTA